MQQGVDKRALIMAGGRMNDHALGFVYHDDILVFIKNIQLDILGRSRHGNGFSQIDVYAVPCRQLIAAFDRQTVHGNVAVFDHVLQSGTCVIRQHRCQINVEPCSALCNGKNRFAHSFFPSSSLPSLPKSSIRQISITDIVKKASAIFEV